MSGFIGGQGVGLPQPANNYGYSPVGGNSRIGLSPGGIFTIPSGRWAISQGLYSFLQVLDPTLNLWVNRGNPGSHAWQYVESDGYNYRVANLTGCMIGAVVTAGGSGYTSPPVVTPSAGNSLWTALVGGAVSTTVTIASAGSGYTYPPIVAFSSPPAGGIPAYGYATLSAGALGSVVVTQQGAGYTVAPTITLFTNPSDPGGNIVAAKATAALAGSGAVVAVVNTNQGSPVTSAPTLSFSGGGGSSATATVVPCFSVTGITVGTAGATVAGSVVDIEFVGGGVTASPAYLQPSTYGLGMRRGLAYAPVSGGAVGTPIIIDGGLFAGTPTPLIVQASGAAPGTAPAATIAVGGNQDDIYLIQLG